MEGADGASSSSVSTMASPVSSSSRVWPCAVGSRQSAARTCGGCDHVRMGTMRAYRLLRDGRGYSEVVGESNYTEALSRLVPRSVTEWSSRECDFELVPEPDNPFDSSAVSVRQEGEVVGYLPREAAAQWTPIVRRVIASGLVPTVSGTVRGSWHRDWNWEKNREGALKLHASVAIHVSGETGQLPINDPPTVVHTLLPRGGALQIQGIEDSYQVFRTITDSHGPITALVDLTSAASGGRSSGRIVIAKIGGQQIGWLTPVSSKRLVPAIDHLISRGVLPVAIFEGELSAVAVNGKLHVARADQMGEDVLNGAPTRVRRLVPRGQSAAFPVPLAYGRSARSIALPDVHDAAVLGDFRLIHTERHRSIQSAGPDASTVGARKAKPVVLRRGANQEISSKKMRFTVSSEAVLDVCAFIVDSSGRASEESFIFFDNPARLGVELTEGVLTVVPAHLDRGVAKVVVAAFATEEISVSEVTVDSADVKLRLSVDELPNGLRAIHIADIYRRSTAWKLRCVLDGWSGGAEAMLKTFGLEMES